ncbi:cobalamin B12-binding domain-containing protein [Hamadaea tsunoensis]|uniref:cobalamin B12-binding domain-containing protein n=1 Tax=Hamadaea tsunoensis TaxID=53368 RepID=UPI000413166E|nr:cobalamin B12-binding domain-containing protein [Hamadaea tsunoensis]
MTAVTDEDRAAYLTLLAEADTPAALGFAGGLLDRGVAPEGVLLDLVARSQARVGELWAANEWSVAQEHAATHVSEQVVAAVGARTAVGASRGLVVVACVDGEWHSMPARLLAEVLRLHGWNVRFLGASVPGPHLLSYLHHYGPDAVALSCSLPLRLTTARRVIEAAREAGVPVIAGGAGFGPQARWALRLGADLAAAGALEAVRALDGRPPGGRPLATVPAAVAADDEHVLIAKRGRELVDVALKKLEEHFPVVRDYTPAQREATEFDLTQIVEFLCAGLFVDDEHLFVSFVEWLAVVLGSRRVPLVTVDMTLQWYAGVLYDFPRALSHLAAGRRVLAAG